MGKERTIQEILFKRIFWTYWLDMQGKGEGKTRDKAVVSSSSGWADEMPFKGIRKSEGKASTADS